MQFIGTGFRKQDNADFNRICDKAAEFDLLVSKTYGKGPFHDGLMDFKELSGMDIFQVSAYNEDDKTLSSRQISDELMAYHDSSGTSNFLDFLADAKTVFPAEFSLIFAADWSEGNPVRLEKINLPELHAYFKRNNSWYAWLYNYSAQRYYPNLGLPLILEIENHIA